MKRKLELDQFFIALEATVSHQIAEAIAPIDDKRRWWNRWASDRQRYKLLMERGGIFPPWAHDWIPENPVHAMAAARVLDCFGLYWVPR